MLSHDKADSNTKPSAISLTSLLGSNCSYSDKPRSHGRPGTPRRPQLKATRLSARPQLKATRLSARPQLKATRLSARPQLKAARLSTRPQLKATRQTGNQTSS